MLYYKTYLNAACREWVVFVHGAGGSSSIWYKQIREFRQHLNVLLIDLRGHGKSRLQAVLKKQKDYTFKEVSKEIIEVLDYLKIQSAHFVGISLGTIIIRTIGEIAPSRIRSMVLGGAVCHLDYFSRILIFVGNSLKRLLPYMWLYSLFAWIIMPKARHRKSRYLFIREAKKLCQKEFIRWFGLTCELAPMLNYFARQEIPVPTLYLMGDQDYMFLPPLKRIIQNHRFAALKVLENSGHVCNVDRADLFNRFAIEFIEELVLVPMAPIPVRTSA